MSLIKVDHLSKKYDIFQKEPGFVGSIKSLFDRKYEIVTAVDDISFSIDEGELVGFIGPNGAGKTTTLKCLSGLLHPDKGEVSVSGFTPYERKKEFLKQISLIMGQKSQLWWDLPPVDTLLLMKDIYEISDQRYKEVVGELTKLLEVEDLLKVQVKRLSLGQRMKFELISALVHSPKVLFLDEPTIGLDVVMQKKLREFIKEYNRKFKATILLTSHYMGDVEELCKRVIIIDHGKILFDGLLSNLIKKYAPYKLIKVVFNNFPNPKKLEGLGQVKDFEYPNLTLSVTSEESNDTAAAILKNFDVEDITIEDPEIEDVIRKVFSK